MRIARRRDPPVTVRNRRVSGVIVNLVVLRACPLAAGIGFTSADGLAIIVAIIWKFFLNNALTYRNCRLTSWRAVHGLVSFMAVCTVGAVVNVAVAQNVYNATGIWLLAGVCNAFIGALLNYALTSIFTWGRRT